MLTKESARETSTAAGSGLTPLPPAPRTPRLDSHDRVRGELARCYRRAAAGLVDWPTACRAGYLLSLLHKMLADASLADLASRIEVLEAGRTSAP